MTEEEKKALDDFIDSIEIDTDIDDLVAPDYELDEATGEYVKSETDAEEAEQSDRQHEDLETGAETEHETGSQDKEADFSHSTLLDGDEKPEKDEENLKDRLARGIRELPKNMFKLVAAATVAVIAAIRSIFMPRTYVPSSEQPVEHFTKKAEDQEKKEKENKGRDRERDKEDPVLKQDMERDGRDGREERAVEPEESLEDSGQQPEQEEPSKDGEEHEDENASENNEEETAKETEEDVTPKEIEDFAQANNDRQMAMTKFLHSDAGKKSLETLGKIYHAKFEVREETGLSGEKRECLSIERNGALSRSIDAESILRGEAGDLAAACKDVGVYRSSNKEDFGDTKHVMAAVGICAKLKSDFDKAFPEMKSSLLARCSFGKDYSVEFTKHRHDARKYEFHTTGMDGKGKESYQSSHISDNKAVYEKLSEAEKAVGSSVIDRYSMEQWKDISEIEQNAGAAYSQNTMDVMNEIAHESNIAKQNMMDSNPYRKNNGEQFHFIPCEGRTLVTEDSVMDSIKAYMENPKDMGDLNVALAVNSPLVTQAMQCIATDHVSEYAQELLAKAGNLSSDERKDLSDFLSKSHEDRQAIMEKCALDGERVGKSGIVSEIIKSNDMAKAYQKECIKGASMKSVAMQIVREARALAGEMNHYSLKKDTSVVDAFRGVKSDRDCMEMVKEYMSGENHNNKAMNELMQLCPSYLAVQDKMVERMMEEARSGDADTQKLEDLFEKIQEAFPVMQAWTAEQFIKASVENPDMSVEDVYKIAEKIMQIVEYKCKENEEGFKDLSKDQQIEQVWNRVGSQLDVASAVDAMMQRETAFSEMDEQVAQKEESHEEQSVEEEEEDVEL